MNSAELKLSLMISYCVHSPRFLKKVEAYLLVIGDDSLSATGSTLVFRLIGHTTELYADVRYIL